MNLIILSVVLSAAFLLINNAVQKKSTRLRSKPIHAFLSVTSLRVKFSFLRSQSFQSSAALILLGTSIAHSLPAEAESIDKKKLLKIEAAYLYKFTKFIHWPDYRFQNSSNLNICLVGKEFSALNQLLTRGIAGKQSNGRTIQVYYYQTPQIGTEHQGCHLVYLDSFLARDLTPKSDINSTLVISSPNTPNNTDSLIHLKVLKGKLVFVINQDLLETSLLEINAALLSLARKTYD